MVGQEASSFAVAGAWQVAARAVIEQQIEEPQPETVWAVRIAL
jgi:hypothetical protein